MIQPVNPLTAETAKAHVIAAVSEAVAALGITVRQAWICFDSTNDTGEGPYRAHAAVHFAAASSPQAAQMDTEAFLQILRNTGWTSNPNFHSLAPHVAKGGVTILFEPQGVGDDARLITALGQCCDTIPRVRGELEQFSIVA